MKVGIEIAQLFIAAVLGGSAVALVMLHIYNAAMLGVGSISPSIAASAVDAFSLLAIVTSRLPVNFLQMMDFGACDRLVCFLHMGCYSWRHPYVSNSLDWSKG